MSREWKPGDVAMVGSTVMIRVSEDQCYVSGGAHQRGDHWHGGTVEYRGTLADQKARPVAVIDPEDREAVDRLLSLFFPGWAHVKEKGSEIVDIDIARMQATLREFADPKPPKPEEPTGLGAVVEDAKGFKYVRGYEDDGHHTHPWHVIDPAATACMAWWQWSDIDVARVLSEGVTP